MALHATPVHASKPVEIYEYQIVQFADGASDFVPNNWMFFDAKIGQMVTKFMPPPYTLSTYAKLNALISKKAPVDFRPVLDWPTYPIILKGQAKTIEDAEEKTRLLKLTNRRQGCLYTEDSDYTPDDKAKQIENKYRQFTSAHDIMSNMPSIETDESSANSAWENNELKNLIAPKSKTRKPATKNIENGKMKKIRKQKKKK